MDKKQESAGMFSMKLRIIRILAMAVLWLFVFHIQTIGATGAVIRVIYAGGYEGRIESCG
jgi:hypothetical protein